MIKQATIGKLPLPVGYQEKNTIVNDLIVGNPNHPTLAARPSVFGYCFKYKIQVIILSSLLISACSSIRNSPKYQLADDYYHFRQKGSRYQKAYVHIQDDSLRVVSARDGDSPIVSKPNSDQFFLKKSFDVDIITVGFKYRPETQGLPRQVNTDFNGNVFLGYRQDRFKVRYDQTPIGTNKSYHHRAMTVGVFAGMGSSAVTPWTTNNQITDEYDGLVLTKGLAMMFGVNSLTVGFGIGWDRLTDRDKDKWIYQNKAWYGLTIGLNIN